MAKLTRLPQFARELLASCPKAGGGVHNWLFRAARVLHHFYPNKRELALLLEKASANCGREVPEQEIIDAICNSASCAWNPGQPQTGTAGVVRTAAWPAYDRDLAGSIWEDVSFAEHPRSLQLFDEVSLAVRSPVCWPDVACAATILRLLHPGRDPLLCAGVGTDCVGTGLLSEWDRGVQMRARGLRQGPVFLDDLQFVVPNPMVAEQGYTKDGRESLRCRDNAARHRRFLVVEFDQKGDEHLQPALLWHLRELAPMALCVHSGGTSLHGWFYVEPQPEQWQMRFFRYAVSIGSDPRMWLPEQLVRMPNGQRRDEDGVILAKQKVLYFDPNCIEEGQPRMPEKFGFFDPAWLKEEREEACHGEVR